MRFIRVVQAAFVAVTLLALSETGNAGIVLTGGNSVLRYDVPFLSNRVVLNYDQTTVPLVLPTTTGYGYDGAAGTVSASITSFNNGTAFGLSPLVSMSLGDGPYTRSGSNEVAVGGGGNLEANLSPGWLMATLSGRITGTLGDGAVLNFDINDGGSTLPQGVPFLDFRIVIDKPGAFDIAFSKNTPAFFASPPPFVSLIGAEVDLGFGADLSFGAGTFSLDPGVGISVVGAQAVPQPSTLVMSSILLGMFGAVWSYKRLKHSPTAA